MLERVADPGVVRVRYLFAHDDGALIEEVRILLRKAGAFTVCGERAGARRWTAARQPPRRRRGGVHRGGPGNGRRYPVELLGGDPGTDVAVVEIGGGQGGFPAARMGPPEGPRVGSWVLTTGHPYEWGAQVSGS